MSFQSNEDYMAALASLIGGWCEQRRLSHLAMVLPSYVAFNGLTDGWNYLGSALRGAVDLGADGLPSNEWAMLQRLSRDAEKALSGR